jgi:hypothetical protein
MRYLATVVLVIAATASCSRQPNRTVAALPTSPSETVSGVSAITFIGGVSGPMDVLFPGRNDSFQFRNDLETKYQTGLNRSLTTTFVDKEGEVVWTQEYIRYRVNGCDHATAVSRVMTQIDGGVAGGICAAPPEGLVLFPSRADSLQFRRELETKYQSMGRGLSSTYVDAEGAVIWIQEYLRYRANACDHATATQKVFSQIDGGPVPDTCFVPCTYVVNPSNLDLPSSSSTQTFEIRPVPTACAFTAESDASWLTFPAEFRNGNGFTPNIPLTVSQNNGSGRTGRITVRWSGGSTQLTVFQAGTPFAASFTMTDPFRSGGGATTECWFRSTNTPCNFTATANLPGSGYVYNWTATYFYGVQETVTQTGPSSSFSISDTCGDTGSTADGAPSDLSVTLTVTDDRGNSVTIRSGDGDQPALVVRRFTC